MAKRRTRRVAPGNVLGDMRMAVDAIRAVARRLGHMREEFLKLSPIEITDVETAEPALNFGPLVITYDSRKKLYELIFIYGEGPETPLGTFDYIGDALAEGFKFYVGVVVDDVFSDIEQMKAFEAQKARMKAFEVQERRRR